MPIGVQIHPDKYDVRLFPADETCGAFTVVRAYEDRGTVSLFMPSPAACDELIRAAAEAKALLTGAPVFCPAFTDLDDETLYCDRNAGHDGSHHAPGPDEGSEVAWSDPEDEEDARFAAEAAELDELEPLPAGKTLQDLLSLVGAHVPLSAIRRWNAGQFVEAQRWAAAEHLHASDNDVATLPKPGHVTAAEPAQDGEPEYPEPGSAIPGWPGFRVGNCGHRVAGSEWRAGFRNCEQCGDDAPTDDAVAILAESIRTGTPVIVTDDAEFAHGAFGDGPDCGCGLGAARCRELEDGGAS